MNTHPVLPVSAGAAVLRFGPASLPIGQFQPSPTNPRKSFDAEKITQLAETIRTQGLLQRPLVRPWPGKANTWELVDGERRWRAAKQLGMPQLDVEVRDLTDAQVVAVQLVAGGTGEGLTALEEAEGFRMALELRDLKSGKPIYTMRSLAEELGCPLAHIEQRVCLLRLPEAVQECVASGMLAPRTANLLARIPDGESRERAVQEVVFPKHREEPLPFREASAVIHERYMVSLRSAPFDVRDATFDGPEGQPLACSACPLKSGNDPERFADVADKNTCTNPACYRAKCHAAWDRAAARAKAAGQRVLTDEETAEVFEKNSPVVEIAFSSPYVDVHAKPSYRHVANEVEDASLPTWRELLESAEEKRGIKVPVVLARDRNGKQWELVQLSLAIEAARAAGEDMFRKAPVNEAMASSARFERDAVRSTVRSSDDFAARKKAEAAAAKRRQEESGAALVALQGALAKRPAGDAAVLSALLPTALHAAGRDGQALLTKAWGLRLGGGEFELSDALEAWFTALPAAEKWAAVVALLVSVDMKWRGLESEGFAEVAKAVGLDVSALMKPKAEKKAGRKTKAGAGAKAEAAVRGSMKSRAAAKAERSEAAAGRLLDGVEHSEVPGGGA